MSAVVIAYVLGCIWAIGSFIVLRYIINEVTDDLIGILVGWMIGLPVWLIVGLIPSIRIFQVCN